mmetsp:Transcript_20630/g.23918  ORF Transcript_20630/g.23918 Transcript_20630/m.23918 type:complete len:89 (+) Transcript_20630:896-1162(+)
MVKHANNHRGMDLRCKMQAFMRYVEKCGIIENEWDDKNEWNHAKVTKLWSAISQKYIYGKFDNALSMRAEQLSWTDYSNWKNEEERCL